jgi:hypothetical protein
MPRTRGARPEKNLIHDLWRARVKRRTAKPRHWYLLMASVEFEGLGRKKKDKVKRRGYKERVLE